jgi:hypothetical protein
MTGMLYNILRLGDDVHFRKGAKAAGAKIVLALERREEI